MGRLQGAALRAKKRGNVAANQMLDQSAQWAEQQSIAQAPNTALFVLDTTALPVPNFRPPKKTITTADKDGKHSIPKLEQQKIQELLEKHDAKTLQDMAKTERTPARMKNNKALAVDLWEDDDDDEGKVGGGKKKAKGAKKATKTIIPKCAGTAPMHSTFRNVRGAASKTVAAAKSASSKQTTTTAPKKVAVQPALAGQSYHPDPQQHQDVIGEALALELRRQEVETYVTTPIASGMCDETKALLVTDDYDEESDNEDDGNDDKEADTKLPRRSEKLTRAQRNKQKRVRSEQSEIQQRKRAKKLLNQVAEVKQIKREIVKEELTKQQRRELIQQQQQLQQEQQPLGTNLIQKQFQRNPLLAPALPVALSNDIKRTSTTTTAPVAGASLRTVHPKGSLIKERLLSFRDRKLVDENTNGTRKRVVQGKRRLRVKGKGHDFAPAGAKYKLMG